MSVRNTKLLMYGVEIQYPHYRMLEGEDESRFDELDIFYDTTPGKVGFVIDGMNGKYAVAGVVMTRFEEGDEWLKDGVTPLEDIVQATISDKRKKEVIDGLEKILGYQPVCRYLFINHWH